MKHSENDIAEIQVLLKRLNKYRLPQLLALKEAVDQGEKLGPTDIGFLERALKDAKEVMPLIDRHPELHKLAAEIASLYEDITSKALENE